MISLQKIVILFFLYTSLAHSAVVFKNGKRVDEPNDLKEEKAKQKDTNISSNLEVVDEERFTSGGQWEISSNDKGFIKYQEQQSKIIINSEDDLDGRSLLIKKTSLMTIKSILFIFWHPTQKTKNMISMEL